MFQLKTAHSLDVQTACGLHQVQQSTLWIQPKCARYIKKCFPACYGPVFVATTNATGVGQPRFQHPNRVEGCFGAADSSCLFSSSRFCFLSHHVARLVFCNSFSSGFLSISSRINLVRSDSYTAVSAAGGQSSSYHCYACELRKTGMALA